MARPSLLITVFILAFTPGGASAQPSGAQPPGAAADQACSAPVELPVWLASWASPTAMRVAANEKAVRKAELTPGKAVRLTLLPTPRLAYPVRPEKPGGTVSYGGLLHFTVAADGVWRVMLASGAWVDVVRDGKAVPSIAHGQGPACTGIRKMVDYRLSPGTYTLQIAANGTESLTLLVASRP